MNTKTKHILTHLGFVIAMFLVACIYFMPLLQGKALPQGDLQKYEGMAKAQKDFHEKTGDYANWCPSMFSGMPGYQITRSPQQSIFTPINHILTLTFMGRQSDIGVLFLYLLGFYVALIALGASPLLALLGALAFGLGSYNIIIIEAGHITKAWAMSMMAPILAGMILALRKKYVWGGILFALALGCQIALNHIQITFYTAIAGVVLGIVYVIFAIKDKTLKDILPGIGVLLLGALLAVACNTRHLFVNEEYSRYTMRGGSELTITPENNPSANISEDGLNVDYAFSWSYGIGETYTLLVPGAMGGSNAEMVSKESASYQAFHQKRMPLYWGDQPFTSGPVYFGAIVVFLFILGLFIVKGPERWWLLIVTIIAIVLSWGKNMMGINGWLFDHLPMYNKFRTPSMSLVIANVTMVIMAVLALKEVVNGNLKNKVLYIATGITGGIIILGLILSSGFSFSGIGDQQMQGAYGNQWQMIQDIFIKDRKALFSADSIRSLLFIVVSALILWLYSNQKIKKQNIILSAICILMVVDLWGVDRRYLNDENYVSNKRQIQLAPDSYDYEIDKQAAQFGDHDFRVLNLAVNTFNDSKPSAFHDQIGGYSAAKLRRYQDIIDFYISGRINMNVIDMLNGRYFVVQGGQVQRNPNALGNAWFVNNIKTVNTADEEILALEDFNPSTTAVVNTKEFELKQNSFANDSTATISLVANTPRNPDHLTYNSNSSTEQLAVFSEIYYSPDWKAYIDGKPAEYIRANYILRAMLIPAGNHKIEFINEAPTLHKLDTITMISSIVLVLVVAGTLIIYYRRKKQIKE